MGCPKAELSLVLVDDEEIARLNSEYLGRQGPTNVLAFPMLEGEFSGLNPDVLGDVVISVPTTLAHAEDGGYTPEEMLDFYLVHGILHLLGYDHVDDPGEAARMEAKTQELWDLLDH
ncbi:MAG: rRNA maturation RNase YbeY [Pseudomonadota bacterium]